MLDSHQCWTRLLITSFLAVSPKASFLSVAAKLPNRLCWAPKQTIRILYKINLVNIMFEYPLSSYSTQCLLDTLSLRNSPPCWCKYHCGLCHRIWRERHKVYSVSHPYHRLWLVDKYLHALLMYFPQHQIWNPPIEIISMRDIVS